MLLHLPWHKLLKGHLGTQQTRGSGVTGNARNAVSQLRANVEKTTDAAVAEGQKNVQAAADAGARYIEEAKSLASNAISTATVCLSISLRGSSRFLLYIQSYLPASLKGGTTGNTAQGGPGNNGPPGSFPSSNAPLENGPRAVDSPYPASEVHAHQAVVNESK